MKNQTLVLLSAALFLLAIGIFLVTRQSAESYSASVAGETPKPRPGSPDFATETGPAPTSREGAGKSMVVFGGQ